MRPATRAPLNTGFGYPFTVDPRLLSNHTAVTANQRIYLRCRDGGPVSKIGFMVGAQSGNISVDVYGNNGLAGVLARPSALRATSGSVACPAIGYQEVALVSGVTMAPGEWLSICADNGTASFYRVAVAGFSSTLGNGLTHHQNSAFTAPNPAVPLTGAMFSIFLIGVA